MKKLVLLLMVCGFFASCTSEVLEVEKPETEVLQDEKPQSEDLTEKDKVCPPSNPNCND